MMQVPERFVKLMMMTASDNDGEALVALRKANAILAEANVNWEEFLQAVDTNKTVTAKPKEKPPWDSDGFSDIGRNAHGQYTDADEINMLFEKVYAKTRPGSSFMEFLDSVHTWWENNGFLTEKQYSAIRKSALRSR